VTRLPRLTGREVIDTLAKGGFKVVRIKGSHHLLRHDDGRATTVPVHGREVIGVGLLSKILRDCGLTREAFISLYEN
jgi:predicted RNA binding protein YcfA (HicA-like mRNA interferase family)